MKKEYITPAIEIINIDSVQIMNASTLGDRLDNTLQNDYADDYEGAW